ncbi:LysR family transcriptional regulator [Halomonas mongoliensis]
MRVFVEAATRGSLSAAARALEMSPAMATKHMDAMEARLGIKLLHRTTRRLSLTDAGSEHLAACRRLLQEPRSPPASRGRSGLGGSRMRRVCRPAAAGQRDGPAAQRTACDQEPALRRASPRR